VEIRSNDAANLLVISGTAPDIDHAISLMKEADVPPRQIEIEVKIVEISTSKARNLGLDWQNTIESIRFAARWGYRESDDGEYSRTLDATASTSLSSTLQFLDQSGAAEIRTAPRILTLNNRPAQILDGQRVTYVIRYGSYTNLYETDSMDAGLNLRVQPSLGESGYITMRITAELTSLSVGRAISGSPIKEGQMLENTIIVRDGESILLGGLSRMVEQKTRKRFPLLGHVLPFLFSREVTNHDQIESFIVLTPRVVDLAAGLDDKTKAALEPPGTK
jgi:type II secretory pathway component GspD/PulD (secretin)